MLGFLDDGLEELNVNFEVVVEDEVDDEVVSVELLKGDLHFNLDDLFKYFRKYLLKHTRRTQEVLLDTAVAEGPRE